MTTKNHSNEQFRVEEDALGDVNVPTDHLWGVQTQRSHLNFPIGVARYKWGRPLIRAMGILKNARHWRMASSGSYRPKRSS